MTRYIRLTHCDIFFADAVILVEGPAEKILVPSFIKKSGLDSYYISVIEINGRHAHSFRSLIEKLGIATLIVTDIDATEKKDEHAEQNPREGAEEGLVRLFVVQLHEGIDKDEVEQGVMKQMSSLTHDGKWFGRDADIKILTLEHMMAARRLGFDKFFAPLSKVSKYQMTFLQGTVPEVEFFTKEVIPLADSMKGDGCEALTILKAYSPLLSKDSTENPYKLYLRAREEANKVAALVNENCTIRAAVMAICDSVLLTVPDVVRAASLASSTDLDENAEEDLKAWAEVMDLPIDMVRGYDDYVNHRSRFDTHQGVKGLEFERVMVIIDDSEARGFMFSYDKLFGVKDLTETDLKNISEGKETSIERTQRLFYVTCTRAKQSLAVVMYTKDPEKVKNESIRKQWFEEGEIDLI